MAGALVLEIYLGDKLHREVRLDDPIRIGRRADDCEVVLSGVGVSRLHATIEPLKGGRALLRDEGSTNGCRIGSEIVRGRTVELGVGVPVGLGEYRLSIARHDVLDLDLIDEDEDDDLDFEQTKAIVEPSMMSDPASVRLEALYRFAAASVGESFDVVMDAAAWSIRQVIEFDVLCILLSHGSTLRVACSFDSAGRCSPNRAPISRSLVRRALRERRAILTDSSEDATDESTILATLEASFCVPLLDKDTRHGVLYLSSSQVGQTYGRSDLEFVTVCANAGAQRLTTR